MSSRIVSLCPSITETLAEIGAGGELVGVTRYCTRPRELVAGIPKVGGTKELDLEKIRALRPGLVFANAEENREEDVRLLQSEFRVHLSFPRKVADVPPMIREFGLETGRAGEASRLAAEIEAAVREPGAATFRYAYVIWRDPWMAVSDDTYVSDLFRYAGGQNVFTGEDRRYPVFTPARLQAASPDVLFFPSEPYPFGQRHRPAIESAFGKAHPIEFVDGDDCCWHGARTRQGLALMGELREKFPSG
jgi:ABC-type Fe3+-hydroxamate transport system substrate-binding protein